MKKVFLVVCILCFSITTYAMPAQVIIVRHAEKDPGTENLNTKGFERAGAFAYYFTRTNALLNYGLPVAIFGARQTNNGTDRGLRIIQTASPVSRLLGVPVNLGFDEFHPDAIVNFILNHRAYDGKNVLIVWHSEGIPCLLNSFGFAPPDIYTGFDIAYVLTFPNTSPGQDAPRVLQELMFGDSTILPPYGTYPYVCPNLPP